jgi:glycosyltransferase involved in cell wall biosynthesis
MDLCVVIPARNEERLLGHQLEALADQQWDKAWEVIVVDNGSTDSTAAIVETFASEFGRVRLVRATEKADKAYAIATAVEATDADALVICDADDIVAPGWLAAIGDALSTNAVVTGPNELDRLNPRWLAESRGRSIEEPVGSFSGIFPCIRGNNFGLQRSVLEKIGPLLSEGFFPVEDIEFSYRCAKAGIPIVGVPGAVVHYRYRSAARTLWRQGWAYGSGRPHIARLLRDDGRQVPRFGGWRSWAMLLVRLPKVVTPAGRAEWSWIAGNRFGQVAGSVRHRTLMV